MATKLAEAFEIAAEGHRDFGKYPVKSWLLTVIDCYWGAMHVSTIFPY